MVVKEVERPLTIDGMWPVEPLDLGPITDPQQVVVTPNPGELPPDPFIGRNAIVMPTLNHERSRSHQR